MYFVIRNCGGDTTVSTYTKEALSEALNTHAFGDNVQFLTALRESDTNYWPENTILIIEGSINVPQIETSVVQYKL